MAKKAFVAEIPDSLNKVVSGKINEKLFAFETLFAPFLAMKQEKKLRAYGLRYRCS